MGTLIAQSSNFGVAADGWTRVGARQYLSYKRGQAGSGRKVIINTLDTISGVITNLTITNIVPLQPGSNSVAVMIDVYFEMYAAGVARTVHTLEYVVYDNLAANPNLNEVSAFQRIITEPAGLLAGDTLFAGSFRIIAPWANTAKTQICARKTAVGGAHAIVAGYEVGYFNP